MDSIIIIIIIIIIIKAPREHPTTRHLTDTWSEQEKDRLRHNPQHNESLTHFYKEFSKRHLKILLKKLTGVTQNILLHIKL